MAAERPGGAHATQASPYPYETEKCTSVSSSLNSISYSITIVLASLTLPHNRARWRLESALEKLCIIRSEDNCMLLADYRPVTKRMSYESRPNVCMGNIHRKRMVARYTISCFAAVAAFSYAERLNKKRP
eukprot:scaffold371810_cov21-Prasinocladus_malaysianus.AAC.1